MGSPFASHTQTTIPLPFDLPHTVTIRKLTGRELEQVQEEHRAGIATSNPRVWATFFRRALERGSASDPDVQKLLKDPLTGYHRYALVRFGLVAWSYDRPVDAAAIDDLDDEACDCIATEVLRLTKPLLFAATEEDAAAAQRELQAAAPVV